MKRLFLVGASFLKPSRSAATSQLLAQNRNGKKGKKDVKRICKISQRIKMHETTKHDRTHEDFEGRKTMDMVKSQ